jgi:hypothetical protein
MQPPSSRKEVQRLTGRIASLNRFISRAAERSLPFFKVLRANITFQWGAEQQHAFVEQRNYLEEAAVMSKPSLKADLLLYIAATETAVSAVLVEERMEADTLKQLPIYYVSEALSGSKLFYSEMEKMAVVWTSLGPLPRWVPGPTTRWALGTTRLALHGT